MKLKKTDIGIASEGSFGLHPYLYMSWNIELVVLFDKRNKLVVNGAYESADTNYNHILADYYDDVLVFAKNIGFPEHHVIMRPDNNKSKKNKRIFIDAKNAATFMWPCIPMGSMHLLNIVIIVTLKKQVASVKEYYGRVYGDE